MIDSQCGWCEWVHVQWGRVSEAPAWHKEGVRVVSGSACEQSYSTRGWCGQVCRACELRDGLGHVRGGRRVIQSWPGVGANEKCSFKRVCWGFLGTAVDIELSIECTWNSRREWGDKAQVGEIVWVIDSHLGLWPTWGGTSVNPGFVPLALCLELVDMYFISFYMSYNYKASDEREQERKGNDALWVLTSRTHATGKHEIQLLWFTHQVVGT